MPKKIHFIDCKESEIDEFINPKNSHNPVGTFRFRLLSTLLAYYRGTQYDQGYKFDWTGRPISYQGGDHVQRLPNEVSASLQAGVPPTTDTQMTGYYPLMWERRPLLQEHLPAEIVDGFSSYLFGHNKFPKVQVVLKKNSTQGGNEPQTGESSKDILEKHFENIICGMNLPVKFSVARPIAGAAGTVIFVLGKNSDLLDDTGNPAPGAFPSIDIYEPQHCTPLWADKRNRILAALEIRYTVGSEMIEKKNEKQETVQKVTQPIWERRIITSSTDETYQSKKGEKYEKDDEIQWEKKGETITHGLGYVPVIWVDNSPPSVQGRDDGAPDFDETDLVDFDEVNRLKSALSKTVFANLEPGLVMKISPKLLAEGGGVVKRGGDTAIVVGEEGDATLLESDMATVKEARNWKEDITQSIFRRRKYIRLKPEDIQGQDISGTAMTKLLNEMFARVDVLRAMWSVALIRILLVVWDMQGEKAHPENISDKDFTLSVMWGPYVEPSLADAKLGADVVTDLVGGEKVFTVDMALDFVAPILHMDASKLKEAMKKAKEEEKDQSRELPQ